MVMVMVMVRVRVRVRVSYYLGGGLLSFSHHRFHFLAALRGFERHALIKGG